MSDELLKDIDGALKAIAPQVKDVLTGEYTRLEHPDVKHWVRAGREPSGRIRLVGQAKALDEVGGAMRKGASFVETEIPDPGPEDLGKFYAGAIERGETTTLAMLLGRAQGVPPAPALPARKPVTKRTRKPKR